MRRRGVWVAGGPIEREDRTIIATSLAALLADKKVLESLSLMADKKQAFWLNLWQASNVDHVPPEEKRLQELIPDFDALHAIAKKIMRLPRLSPEPPLLLDAMSYIIVPPGSSPQAWHIDFNMGNCPGMVPMLDDRRGRRSHDGILMAQTMSSTAFGRTVKRVRMKRSLSRTCYAPALVA